MPVVYMATNTVNGKRYIGATKYTLEKRKTSHLYHAARGSHTCRKFHPAIKKYGSDNFSWVILAEYADAKEAFKAEERLIAELKPEYNTATGGENGASGVKRTPQYCNNLSRIHKGKKLSDEAKAKMLATRKERLVNCIQVMCLDDGIVYPSVQHAASAYAIGAANLTGLIKGYKNFSATRNGKHFIYYTEPLSEEQRLALIAEKDKAAVDRRRRGRKPYEPNSSNRRNSLGRSNAGPLKIARPVLCVTTGRHFQSASEAGRHYDICIATIYALCAGKNNRKTAGGLVFRFLDNKEAA